MADPRNVKTMGVTGNFDFVCSYFILIVYSKFAYLNFCCHLISDISIVILNRVFVSFGKTMSRTRSGGRGRVVESDVREDLGTEDPPPVPVPPAPAPPTGPTFRWTLLFLLSC